MSELPHAHRDNNPPRDGGQDVYHGRSSTISILGPPGSNLGSTGPTASSNTSQPASLSVASLFSQLTPDWEIEERTHLPLHLTNCDHCFQFARHVMDYTRGRALSMLVSLQREHWRKGFEDELRGRENDAYSAGLDKNQHKIDQLEDDIEDCYNRLKERDREIDYLRQKLDELRADNARVSGGGASRGRNTSRSPPRRRHSPRRPQPDGPTGTRKGKQPQRPVSPSSPPRKKSRTMYDTNSDDSSVIRDELRGNTPLNSEEEDVVVATVENSALRAREAHRLEGEATASSSTNPPMALSSRISHPHGKARTGGGRPLVYSQTPPGQWGRWIGDPAPFRLHHIYKDAFLDNKYGHACLGPKTYWAEDTRSLWRKHKNPEKWFWLHGRNSQIAKEAARIPFDQRSLAQRWTVREATRDDFLPLDDGTAEPNVEQLASTGSLPSYIRRGSDGRYNVYDITAWLFLVMAQPDPAEGTVAWFWELACSLLSTRGRFMEVVSTKYKIGETPPSYVQTRFVHEGEYKAIDVALHLFHCGLTSRDANTHFHDLANSYREHHPSTTEPEWAIVPSPRPLVTRPTLSQRRKKKGGPLAPATSATASNPKTLAERLEGSGPITGGTPSVPTYDEAPPTGSPYLDAEMHTTADEPEEAQMAVDRPSSFPMGPG